MHPNEKVPGDSDAAGPRPLVAGLGAIYTVGGFR